MLATGSGAFGPVLVVLGLSAGAGCATSQGATALPAPAASSAALLAPSSPPLPLAALPPPRPVQSAAPPPVDAASAAPAGNDAGSVGPAADGLLWLPQESHAIHSHRGDAAHLSKVRFVARNTTRRPASFRVTSAEFLTSNACDVPPQQPGRAIAPKSLGPSAGAKDALTATVAPGAEVEFTVEFAPPVDAYYTYCNRFGVRLRGVAGGKALEVMSETRVQREDP